MKKNISKIDELLHRIEALSEKQRLLNEELQHISEDVKQLANLQKGAVLEANSLRTTENSAEGISFTSPEIIDKAKNVVLVENEQFTEEPHLVSSINDFRNQTDDTSSKLTTPKQKSDLEKIIGESWINKIGILILIIGVFYGITYSIENNLISPSMRIVLGYVTSGGLLFLGYRLRAKYEGYSSVLVSGAMAIAYFITFFAYDLYGLIPFFLAFLLMVFFTAYTVFAAFSYNRSVIAFIGLVGAYAIPFLLSSGVGNILALLIYIGLINGGILWVSIKKDWKSPFYMAFGFTWLILLFLVFEYKTQTWVLITMATLFFKQFYAVAIINRIFQNKKVLFEETGFLFLNSFLYFGAGAIILMENNDNLLSTFTLWNAVVHFGVNYLIKIRHQANTIMYAVTLGLSIMFVAIAIPIEFEGKWIPLLWAVQAAVLFWIGRTKNISFFDYFSVMLSILSFITLFIDNNHIENPFLNIYFWAKLAVAGTYLAILYFSVKYITEKTEKQWNLTLQYIFSVLLIIVTYLTFYKEITLIFYHWSENSAIKITSEDIQNEVYNPVVNLFKTIVLIIYSVLFVVMMAVVNIFKVKNKILGISNLVLFGWVFLFSLTAGLVVLGELRDEYITPSHIDYFPPSWGYVGIRYLFFAVIALAILMLWKYIKQDFMMPIYRRIKEVILLTTYGIVLIFLSNELITWLALQGNQSVFKLGLSILWGLYSLALICIGIFKHQKHLRIASIVLFGVTLVKLFFYDISHLNTISKIIVFISLGVLLLLISFLYNKFKDKISAENQLEEKKPSE